MKGNSTMMHNVEGWIFHLAFESARRESDQVREATSEYADVEGTRYFLDSDNRTGSFWGYAIRPDGELVYVFSMERGRGAAIVESAIANGATHLDCFDGYLVDRYSHHGFHRVTSLPNWTPGEPDVVHMALPGHFLTALDKAERSVA